MPDANGMYSPATDSAMFRSKDEMQNLYFALFDAIVRAKGLGDLADLNKIERVDLDELLGDEKEAIQTLIKELMQVWGVRAENAQLDQDDEQAREGTDIQSGFGAATHRPFVTIKANGQYRPESARQVALQLLDAAAVAETDGTVVAWVEETLDMKGEAAIQMMHDLRKFRVASREDDLSVDAEMAPDVLAIRRGTTRAIGQERA